MTLPDYIQQLSTFWNHTALASKESGYERVVSSLVNLSTEQWRQAGDSEKKRIEEEIFSIYRSVNIVPIQHYSLDGCINEVRHVATNHAAISGAVVPSSNIGQSLCKYWFPSMESASTLHDRAISLSDRFFDDVKLQRAIQLCLKHKRSVLPVELKSALSLVGGNVIQNFKPMSARAIVEHICPVVGGRVLDYSAGYGGRMLGVSTSPFRYEYTGLEPNTATFQSLGAFSQLVNESIGTCPIAYNTPSEEFIPDAGYYDCAFSSPPYYNLEIYSDEPTQCMNRYHSVDEWFDGYVRPTVQMIGRALASDGVYACNIADYKIEKKQYAVVDRWITLSEKCGWRLVDTLSMNLQQRPGSHSRRAEGIYIFKRIVNTK